MCPPALVRLLPLALCPLLVATACAPDFIACYVDEEVVVEVAIGGNMEAREALARAVANEVARTAADWVCAVPDATTANLHGFRVKAFTETFAASGGQPGGGVWVQCGYIDGQGEDPTRRAVLIACRAEVERALQRVNRAGA